ncbi:PQQ-binding-like beta-propeller repeat protein [Streptomyces sp. NPDC002619]|uniref:outer membrane protein assembly factor BamB family protein n=1 Tax=Streptomyces sp. NPDC002619 TaxID=3364655 RepID=UPI0036853D1C
MRRTWQAVAALLGLVLAGCAGSGSTPSGKPSRTTVSAPGVPSTLRAQVAVSGPWRAWTASFSAQEGRCGATAHQIVCRTGSGGLVGRSRVTGEVTWAVPPTGGGKDAALVVDSADERAVTGSGAILRAANLRTGTAAWTRRLTDGNAFPALAAADGTVYVLETPAKTTGIITLGAFRASDGRTLWHRTIDADPYGGIAAFGGRVYTTDGTKVTARDARTGAAVATSPQGVECPNLISGGHYLVCTGSPYSAEDTFPPLQRLDPVTLGPLPTAEDTSLKPERGLISSDGVLVLFEDSAEDPGAGDWNAYDLVHHRRLWSYATTTEEAELAGEWFVTFTPVNDAAVRGRVITIDLHAGPQATGAAAPRMSAPYPQTRDGEYPTLVVPGGDSGHIVVQAGTHRGLRSIPLP